MPKKKINVVIKNPNYEAQHYCFKKGIKIYPVPINEMYKIQYLAFGKIGYKEKGKLYKREEVYQEIWNLYDEMYNYFKDII